MQWQVLFEQASQQIQKYLSKSDGMDQEATEARDLLQKILQELTDFSTQEPIDADCVLKTTLLQTLKNLTKYKYYSGLYSNTLIVVESVRQMSLTQNSEQPVH